jgi:hypothetical protein
MPHTRGTNRGGNRAGYGRVKVFIGKPAPQPSARRQRVTASETGTCQECDQIIGLREDGLVRNHRTGSRRQGYWPCAGSLQLPIMPLYPNALQDENERADLSPEELTYWWWSYLVDERHRLGIGVHHMASLLGMRATGIVRCETTVPGQRVIDGYERVLSSYQEMAASG